MHTPDSLQPFAPGAWKGFRRNHKWGNVVLSTPGKAIFIRFYTSSGEFMSVGGAELTAQGTGNGAASMVLPIGNAPVGSRFIETGNTKIVPHDQRRSNGKEQ